MIPRIYKPLNLKSFFLFGARGTGKTTWLKQQFPDSTYIDLLDSRVYRQLLAHPEKLESLIKTPTCIIDEVQKIPNLLDEVHRLIELKKIQFVLTGSSARKLRRGKANLLAGRAIQKFFFPLTIWELQEQFNLQQAIIYGLLPCVYFEELKEQTLNTYVQTYLKEEVQAEGLTRNLSNFARFLETISFSQAQPISNANIAKDVQVDPKVIQSYLEILEDLLLGIRIPVFNKKAKRRMTTHPKFFYFDTGVYQTLRPRGILDPQPHFDGPALETIFLHHLRVLHELNYVDQNIFYWRTSSNSEVDFITYGKAGLFAFEITKSPVIKQSDLESLKLFQQDYPLAKCFYLYGGSEFLKEDKILIIPYEEGLRKLPEIYQSALEI